MDDRDPGVVSARPEDRCGQDGQVPRVPDPFVECFGGECPVYGLGVDIRVRPGREAALHEAQDEVCETGCVARAPVCRHQPVRKDGDRALRGNEVRPRICGVRGPVGEVGDVSGGVMEVLRVIDIDVHCVADPVVDECVLGVDVPAVLDGPGEDLRPSCGGVYAGHSDSVLADAGALPGEGSGIVGDGLDLVEELVPQDPVEAGVPVNDVSWQTDDQVAVLVNRGGHVPILEACAELYVVSVGNDDGAVGGADVVVVRSVAAGAQCQKDGEHSHDDDGDHSGGRQVPEAPVVLDVHQDEPELALAPDGYVLSAMGAEGGVPLDLHPAVRAFHVTWGVLSRCPRACT